MAQPEYLRKDPFSLRIFIFSVTLHETFLDQHRLYQPLGVYPLLLWQGPEEFSTRFAPSCFILLNVAILQKWSNLKTTKGFQKSHFWCLLKHLTESVSYFSDILETGRNAIEVPDQQSQVFSRCLSTGHPTRYYYY